jgi:hypothetical protein
MEFELDVGEEHLEELRRRFDVLLPIKPTIIEVKDGHMGTSLGRIKRGRFNDGISRLHIDGFPIEARIKPKISHLSYQIMTDDVTRRIVAINYYMSFMHEDSHGSVDFALERAKAAVEVVMEHVKKSMNRRTLGRDVGQAVACACSVGASSLVYGHEFIDALRDTAPDAYFTEIFQANNLRKDVSNEEAESRFELMREYLTMWKQRELKFLIQYPIISKGLYGPYGDIKTEPNRRVFNNILQQVIELLLDFSAEHMNGVRSGMENVALDLEFGRLYSRRKVLLTSAVLNAPCEISKVEWLVDLRLLKGLEGDISDRIYVLGLFDSPINLDSVRRRVEGGGIRAFAVRSNNFERSYIFTIELSEDEAKTLLSEIKDGNPHPEGGA